MFTQRKISFILFIALFLVAFISCDQEVSTSPPEPEPPQGFIYVKSKPTNFKIYLDGRFTGRFTPDSIPFVEETIHDVTLKRELWRDTSFIVEAKENELALLDVDLLVNPKMYGNVRFVTQPEGAQIIFDGSLLQQVTPFTLGSILPGRYNVEFKYPQHRANSTSVTVKSNQTSNISIALRDTSIWVDYNSLTAPLPTNVLTDISVGQDDVVWIATVDAGIVRHKGKDWKIFDKSNSLIPNDRIKTIFVDQNNNKWIGTDAGLVLMDENEVMTIFTNTTSELPSNIINDINGDENGNIWIGTQNGLARYSSGTLSNINIQDFDLPRTAVQVVQPISQNDVWVAFDSLITRFDGNDFQIYSWASNDIPNTNATGIDLTSNGTTWAAFSTHFVDSLGNVPGGVGYYDGGSWHSTLVGGVNTQIYDLFVDNNDVKWLSTDQGLLKIFELNTSEAIRPNNSGILSEDIRAVAEDSKGTLWIATGDGLAKYKKHLDTE